jgi:hypothetical protein
MEQRVRCTGFVAQSSQRQGRGFATLGKDKQSRRNGLVGKVAETQGYLWLNEKGSEHMKMGFEICQQVNETVHSAQKKKQLTSPFSTFK